MMPSRTSGQACAHLTVAEECENNPTYLLNAVGKTYCGIHAGYFPFYTGYTNRARPGRKARQTMTQAQAVSREPTMEEILASIRRIIEDGNPPKIELDADEGKLDGNANDVAAFSREFAEADVFTQPVREAMVSGMEQKAEPSLIEMPVIDSKLIEASIAAPESAAVSNVPQPFQELRPIISQAAERQVARSFEHLQVALNEERNTSVAAMTEEMLRPLLQDWLDNNLPTLVERLVREEIERVARGPR